MESEFRQRREQFCQKISTGVGVFRSAPTAVMHNDVEYNFRQDSNFYYLTGFNEPEAVAVLAPNHPEHRFILFVRPKDALQETWSGRRVGVDSAQARYGSDAVYPIAELDEKLPQYLETGEQIFYRLGRDRHFDEVILRHYTSLLRTYPKRGTGPTGIADPFPLLAPLRLIKSDAELALMRRAVEITVEAHNLAREMAQPGRYEYEIQAEIERLFRLRGGDGPAYPSIVAAAKTPVFCTTPKILASFKRATYC
jgi:Xaa-Pro aminopeptidase